MTSRERVLTAMNHGEPDRVPFHIEFTPEAGDKLLSYLQSECSGLKNLPEHASDIPLIMEHDMLVSPGGIGMSYYLSDEDKYTCEWGITWRWVNIPGGKYTEMVEHPLADENCIESYLCPDPHDQSRYSVLKNLIRTYSNSHAIVGGMGSILFEPAWHLRGYEQFLTDLVLNRDFAHTLLDKIFDYQLVSGKIMAELGVDILWLGDDFGTQDSLIISRSIWREFFEERYANLFCAYKEVKPDIKIAFHSDGNVTGLLPDFIEVGVDIFQAVQPKSLNTDFIKKKFGSKLSFWGGVDIQEVMPYGSISDIHDEVRLRIKTLGECGGFIISPSHSIQPDVPIENILAFYDAVKKFGVYPIN